MWHGDDEMVSVKWERMGRNGVVFLCFGSKDECSSVGLWNWRVYAELKIDSSPLRFHYT